MQKSQRDPPPYPFFCNLFQGIAVTLCLFSPNRFICRGSGGFGRGAGWCSPSPRRLWLAKFIVKTNTKWMLPSKTQYFLILFHLKLHFSWEWHHFYELAWLRWPLEPLGSPRSPLEPPNAASSLQRPPRDASARDPLGFLFSKKKMPNHKNLFKATKNSLKWKSDFSWKVAMPSIKINQIANFWRKAHK